MTTERGWVEPLDASEFTAQHDDLEHWLQGIRTDLADSPPEWLDTTATSDGDTTHGDISDGDTSGGDIRDGSGALLEADAQVTSDDRHTSSQPSPQPTPQPSPQPISQPSEVQHVGRHRAED